MCGLTAWFWPSDPLDQGTSLTRHRGMDDYDFLTWTERSQRAPKFWPSQNYPNSVRIHLSFPPQTAVARVALRHRRLNAAGLRVSTSGKHPSKRERGYCPSWLPRRSQKRVHRPMPWPSAIGSRVCLSRIPFTLSGNDAEAIMTHSITVSTLKNGETTDG